jgi:hypothetical protein
LLCASSDALSTSSPRATALRRPTPRPRHGAKGKLAHVQACQPYPAGPPSDKYCAGWLRQAGLVSHLEIAGASVPVSDACARGSAMKHGGQAPPDRHGVCARTTCISSSPHRGPAPSAPQICVMGTRGAGQLDVATSPTSPIVDASPQLIFLVAQLRSGSVTGCPMVLAVTRDVSQRALRPGDPHD